MIRNLPKLFPTESLEQWEFGDVDAQSDDLLEKCYYQLDSVREFLKDGKSLAVGERGAGKSAVFKMIVRGHLKFDSPTVRQQYIVPIEEELEYRLLKNELAARGQTWGGDELLGYRMVWELLILQRLLSVVDEKFAGTTNAALQKARADMREVFGEDDATLAGIISNQKLALSLKMEADPIKGTVAPVLSVSAEPTPGRPKRNPPLMSINLQDYKAGIHSFMALHNSALYVVIDRLDEFAVLEEYDTQRAIVQALLETERSYQQYPSIRFKVFLRRDLYEKLNLAQLGADKVGARTVDISWKTRDIRGMIAGRIMYNYSKRLDTARLHFSVRGDDLYVDEQSLLDEADWSDGGTWIHRLLRRLPMLWRLFREPGPDGGILEIWRRDGRRVSLKDELAKQIIGSVFPGSVKHKNATGRHEPIAMDEFLRSHFLLGSGETTPRIMVTFLQECLEQARAYYRANPDEKPEYNDRGYELFKSKQVLDAYGQLQRKLLRNVVQDCDEWSNWLEKLVAKRDRNDFTLKAVQKLIGSDDAVEVGKFVAFLKHIGYLKCANPYADPEERRYSLPVLFR